MASITLTSPSGPAVISVDQVPSALMGVGTPFTVSVPPGGRSSGIDPDTGIGPDATMAPSPGSVINLGWHAARRTIAATATSKRFIWVP